jgi:hypothetical protein
LEEIHDDLQLVVGVVVAELVHCGVHAGEVLQEVALAVWKTPDPDPAAVVGRRSRVIQPPASSRSKIRSLDSSVSVDRSDLLRFAAVTKWAAGRA